MAQIPVAKQTTFQTVGDPVYNLTSLQYKMDSSTSRTNIQEFLADNGAGSGSLATPLKDDRITFKIDFKGQYPRLDNSYFQIGYLLTNRACTGDAVGVSVPWNAQGAMIEELLVTPLGSDKPLIQKGKGQYIHFFNAQALTQMTAEAMKKRGDIFFSPQGSDTYTVGKENAATWDPTCLQTIQGKSTGTHVAAAGDAVEAGVASICNPLGVQGERLLNYWGVGGWNQQRYMCLPLKLMMGLSYISHNMTGFIVKIKFAVNQINGRYGNQEVLERTSSGADGVLSIGSIKLVSEMYEPSTSKVLELVKEKTDGYTDNFSYMDVQVTPVPLNIDGIQNINIPAVRNLQSVIMYQMGYDMENHLTTTTNGAAVARSYNSCGEFFIGNSNYKGVEANGSNDNYLKRADQPVTTGAQATPWNELQFRYNGVLYPESSIKTQNADGSFNPLPLFQEHLKATGCGSAIDNKNGTFMTDYSLFKKTGPFVHVKIWSGNNLHYTPEDLPLTIYMNRTVPVAGSAVGAIPSRVEKMYVCCLTPKVMIVPPSGIPLVSL